MLIKYLTNVIEKNGREKLLLECWKVAFSLMVLQSIAGALKYL